MLQTWQFYVLWFTYACGAGAGLMIVSKLAKMVDIQAGVKLGFVLAAVLAVGNGAGWVVAGSMSDKIGRKATLVFCFVLQAICILLSLASAQNALGALGSMALISALLGANCGDNLAIFASITRDFYGLKNFGVNYGLVFTSWGLGGFMPALLKGKVYDATQDFGSACYCAAGLRVAAAAVTCLVNPPRARAATDN